MGDYEADMRAEWASLGKDPEEFTVEKMAEIWQKQEEEEVKQATAAGKDQLDRKLELMRARKDAELDLQGIGQDLLNLYKSGEKALARGARSAYREVEPGFLRQAREWKDHEKRLKRKQEDIEYKAKKRFRDIARRHKQRKEEQERAKARLRKKRQSIPKIT